MSCSLNIGKQLLRSLGLVVIVALGVISTLGSGGGEIETGPDVGTPSNLRIVSTSVTTIGLDWDYTGPVDVTTGFNVYRNGQKVTHTAGTSYTDYSLTPNTYYCYTVTAYNFWGESGHSNRVCATTPADTAKPTTPGNFVAENTYNNDAFLEWNRSTDNVGVIGYKIFRNNNYLMTVTGTSATDSGLSDNTDYCYYVIAYDLAGYESDPSTTACVDTAWHIENVNPADYVSELIDIAIDSNNKAHIIYIDDNTLTLKYTTNSSGSWNTEIIHTFADSLLQYASIALDSSDKVHISYYDTTDSYLKYATNKSGSWVSGEIVDNSMNYSGRYNSIAIDSLDHVHISYVNSLGAMYASNASGSWISELVDSNGDRKTVITIDSKNNPHIAYISYKSRALFYANKTTGAWTPVMLVDYYIYYSLDMDIDPDDNVHICHADYITNKSGQWVIADVGDYLSLDSCSIRAESQNDIHISHHVTFSRIKYTPYYTSYTYYDIRYTRLKNNEWLTYTLDDITPWKYNSLDLGTDGSAHIVFYGLHDLGLKYVTNLQ